MLPDVPEWKYKTVSLTGHPTKEPTLLFYRDALKCVEYLFGNPVFAHRVDFCPTRLYRNSERTIRVYTEWMTGNAAWEMQVCTHASQNSTPSLTFPIGKTSRWCNAPQHYHLLG